MPDGRRQTLIHALLYTLVVLAAVVLADRTRLADPDLYMNFLCARDVVELGHVPEVDTHSFAREGLPWTINEWLGQVALFKAYELVGGPGLVLLRALLAAAAAGFLLLAARRGGASPAAAAAGVLVVWPAVAHFFLFRVRGMSFALLALLLWWLVEHRRGARWVAPALPLLFLLWSNLHGAFVLGLVVMVLAAADDWNPWRREPARVGPRWPLTVSLAGCVALAMVHPSGPGVYELVFSTVGGEAISTISEWLPVWSHPLSATWTYAVLLLLALPLAAIHFWQRRSLLFPILLLGVAFQTALHVRYGVLLGLVTAVPLATVLDRIVLNTNEARRSVALGLTVLVALAVPAMLVIWRPPDLQVRHSPDLTPVAALRFMEVEDIDGDVITEFEWGAYLAYSRPESRVFIDTRSDMLYPIEVVREWETIVDFAPGWEALLAGSGATALLLDASKPLQENLAPLPGWYPVYTDEEATLVLRDCEVNRAFLTRLSRGEVPPPPPVTDEDLILR